MHGRALFIKGKCPRYAVNRHVMRVRHGTRFAHGGRAFFAFCSIRCTRKGRAMSQRTVPRQLHHEDDQYSVTRAARAAAFARAKTQACCRRQAK